VREFGPHTEDLVAVADWFDACRIDTVALESTGVYWIALYEVLQKRGFDVWLVDAKSVRQVKARKSDVLDCQWLQQLHSFGLLCKAHRPDEEVCALREMSRLRDITIEERARHTQRMQKALTQMNVQLTNVITDITGETGMNIIRAIVAGERDREVLAQLRNYRIHASSDDIAKALEGTWSREHLFSLGHELKAYDFASAQIAALDTEIAVLLEAMRAFNQTPKAHPNKGRRKNTLAFDGRRALMNWCGVDLTEVPGIDVGTALKILSELGISLHRFKTVKHFARGWGCAPGPGFRATRGFLGPASASPTASRARSSSQPWDWRARAAPWGRITEGWPCAWARPKPSLQWRISSLVLFTRCSADRPATLKNNRPSMKGATAIVPSNRSKDVPMNSALPSPRSPFPPPNEPTIGLLDILTH
jgi:transposase